MDQIGTYLKELITYNELVCIPGLGGFLSKQVSATYDSSTNIFTPPHKQIAFNQRLSAECDLLINVLQKKNNLSKAQAITEVEEFVKTVKDSLSENQEFDFNGLGLLYVNSEGEIGFKPDLSPSVDPLNFGLPQILNKFSVIQRPTKNLQKPKDRKAMSNSELHSIPDPGSPGDNPVKKEFYNENKQPNLAWLYIITPIILFVTLGMYLGGTDDGRKVLANMNLYTAPHPADSVFSQANEEETLEETGSAYSSAESFDNAVSAEETIKNTENNVFSEDVPKSKQEEIAKTDEPILTVSNIISGKSGRSFIIAGGFANKKNAVRLREKLVQEGMESKIIAPVPPINLYRVTLGDYPEKSVAFQKAAEFKPTYGDNIWVMVY